MSATATALCLFACKALLNEAQSKLVEITRDQNHYKSILQSLVEQVTTACSFSMWNICCFLYLLIFCHYSVERLFFCIFTCTQAVSWVSYHEFLVKNVQGLYQMLEDKVSIRCRQKDEKLVTVSIQHLNVYYIYIFVNSKDTWYII